MEEVTESPDGDVNRFNESLNSSWAQGVPVTAYPDNLHNLSSIVVLKGVIFVVIIITAILGNVLVCGGSFFLSLRLRARVFYIQRTKVHTCRTKRGFEFEKVLHKQGSKYECENELGYFVTFGIGFL